MKKHVIVQLDVTLCTDTFCIKRRNLPQLSHFLIKLRHFVVSVAKCNKPVTFCNKKPDAFVNKILSHFVIKQLAHFVAISVAFCNKISS